MNKHAAATIALAITVAILIVDRWKLAGRIDQLEGRISKLQSDNQADFRQLVVLERAVKLLHEEIQELSNPRISLRGDPQDNIDRLEKRLKDLEIELALKGIILR